MYFQIVTFATSAKSLPSSSSVLVTECVPEISVGLLDATKRITPLFDSHVAEGEDIVEQLAI